MDERKKLRKLFEELHRFCQIDAAPTMVDEMDERTAVTVLCATAVLAHSRLMRAPDDPLAWTALRRVQLARDTCIARNGMACRRMPSKTSDESSALQETCETKGPPLKQANPIGNSRDGTSISEVSTDTRPLLFFRAGLT